MAKVIYFFCKTQKQGMSIGAIGAAVAGTGEAPDLLIAGCSYCPRPLPDRSVSVMGCIHGGRAEPLIGELDTAIESVRLSRGSVQKPMSHFQRRTAHFSVATDQVLKRNGGTIRAVRHRRYNKGIHHRDLVL